MRNQFRIGIVTGALCLAVLACGSGTDSTGPTPISADQLASAIAAGDAPFVLDVRSEAEFSAGHIPGAVNIPHSEVADRLSELPSDRGTEIVVHCQSGRRAQAAEAALAEAGFTNVRDLEGHMQGWREGNLPIE